MLYLKAIILFGLCSMGALTIGCAILKFFNFSKTIGRIEEIVFSFALGMAFLSFLVFFLGLFHALFLAWLIPIVAIVFLISLRNGWQAVGNIFSIPCRATEIARGKFEAFLCILIVIVLTITFIGAMAPEKGNDSLVYHLADAKYFACHHEVVFIPYTSNSIWPYFMEMLFTLGMMFNNVPLAKLFHFAMALFLGIAVYAFGKRYFNRNMAFIGAAVFFLTPAVFTQATYTYIDLGWALYTFLSFYALYLWNFTDRKGLLILSAVLSGIAADTKYVALIIPAIIALMLIVMGFRQRKALGVIMKNLFIFGAVAALVAIPYYARPYLYTGNPFYPFYAKYIAESGWYNPSNFGLPRNLLNVFVTPWFLTYHPYLFGGGENQPGSVYLAFLPGISLIRKRDRPVNTLISFACVFYLLWFFAFPVARYTLPLMPFLALLVGYLIWSFEGWLKGFLKGAFIVFMSLNFILALYYSREEVLFFAKGARVDDYLRVYDRSSAIYQYINKNTPPDSNILIINEIRTMYLDRDNMRDNYYRVKDMYQLKTASEIVDDLKRKGVTHILYAESLHSLSQTEAAAYPQKTVPDNRLERLIKGKDFVDKYLAEVTEIEYNADPSQRTRYMLYKLK